MPIIQEKKFQRKDFNKTSDSFTVWLNPEERETLEKAKQILNQIKDSTALKQLAFIGAKLLYEEKISYILTSVLENKRKNKRIGLIDFD